MIHGARSGYNNGCRCPSCREANTAASRARRERIAGCSVSIRTGRRPRQIVLEGPRLVSQRPPISSPQPERVHRTRDGWNAGRNDWDTYAQLLRLYLAGVGQSPSLLALQDEVDAYYSMAGEYGR
jgi:hypothetical protein